MRDVQVSTHQKSKGIVRTLRVIPFHSVTFNYYYHSIVLVIIIVTVILIIITIIIIPYRSSHKMRSDGLSIGFHLDPLLYQTLELLQWSTYLPILPPIENENFLVFEIAKWVRKHFTKRNVALFSDVVWTPWISHLKAESIGCLSPLTHKSILRTKFLKKIL